MPIDASVAPNDRYMQWAWIWRKQVWLGEKWSIAWEKMPPPMAIEDDEDWPLWSYRGWHKPTTVESGEGQLQQLAASPAHVRRGRQGPAATARCQSRPRPSRAAITCSNITLPALPTSVAVARDGGPTHTHTHCWRNRSGGEVGEKPYKSGDHGVQRM